MAWAGIPLSPEAMKKIKASHEPLFLPRSGLVLQLKISNRGEISEGFSP
jgi:hypothetical protein